jgi:hypothetical protein
MSVADERRLSQAASALLDNRAYQQAREQLIYSAVAQWIASRPDEISRREQLYQQICALGDVQSGLVGLIAESNEESTDNG